MKNELANKIKFRGQGKYNLDNISITIIKTNKTRSKEEYTHTIHILTAGKQWLELKPKTDKRKIGNKTLADILYKNRRKIIRWLFNG